MKQLAIPKPIPNQDWKLHERSENETYSASRNAYNTVASWCLLVLCWGNSWADNSSKLVLYLGRPVPISVPVEENIVFRPTRGVADASTNRNFSSNFFELSENLPFLLE